MASTSTSKKSNDDCKMCAKIGLRPLTRENVLYYYIPIHSMVTYAGLGINVMNPSLAARLIPNKDITNVLLFSTLFGTSFYVYSRPHLKGIPTGKRVQYSILGSTMFGLGSVLVWAILRSVVPKSNAPLATTIGLASGAAIVKLSMDYFNDCDKLAIKNA